MNRVGAAGRALRIETVAPLFTWMREHGAAKSRVVTLAFLKRTGAGVSHCRAYQIETGRVPAPHWLIDECCAVLGVSRETIYGASPRGRKSRAHPGNESSNPQGGPEPRPASIPTSAPDAGASVWDVA